MIPDGRAKSWTSGRNEESSAVFAGECGGASDRPSFGSINGCALGGSGRATVHHDLGSGDVGSIIRRQVQDGFRYLVGFAKAAERNSPRYPLL